MNVTLVGDRSDFDLAVKASTALGTAAITTTLNAAVDAALIGRLDDVWDDIVAVLRRGYEFGRDAAREYLDETVTRVDRLLAEAGSRARDVQDLLLQRLQVFVQTFVTNALKRIPSTLAVGDRTYSIAKVTCTQKVVMAGSLKMNLTEVFSLTSNGELQITVDYASVP